MDALVDFLTPLTVWHWVALGLVLIGIEMMIGTFDLLWIGTAALLTGLYSSGLIPLPDAMMSWEAQIAAFVVLAVLLAILGRTAFAGLRKPPSSHPGLNRRAESLVGRRATVAGDFADGAGRIKLGDTTWGAQSATGEDFREGEAVIVESAQSTVLVVRRF